ncbi:MAG: hypothetical protein H0V23_01975 [Nocardioidaceae bacterium]|nr:hypothetical protein [Nocardioidaceae bacterium]
MPCRGGRPLVTRFGGGMMVAVGVLLVTGAWDTLVGELRSWAAGFTVGI